MNTYYLAVVLEEDNTVVYGYCSERETISEGDAVVLEDDEPGKVLMVDNFVSMEQIHKYVDETGLMLKRIMEKVYRRKFEWREDDE